MTRPVFLRRPLSNYRRAGIDHNRPAARVPRERPAARLLPGGAVHGRKRHGRGRGAAVGVAVPSDGLQARHPLLTALHRLLAGHRWLVNPRSGRAIPRIFAGRRLFRRRAQVLRVASRGKGRPGYCRRRRNRQSVLKNPFHGDRRAPGKMAGQGANNHGSAAGPADILSISRAASVRLILFRPRTTFALRAIIRSNRVQSCWTFRLGEAERTLRAKRTWSSPEAPNCFSAGPLLRCSRAGQPPPDLFGTNCALPVEATKPANHGGSADVGVSMSAIRST